MNYFCLLCHFKQLPFPVILLSIHFVLPAPVTSLTCDSVTFPYSFGEADHRIHQVENKDLPDLLLAFIWLLKQLDRQGTRDVVGSTCPRYECWGKTNPFCPSASLFHCSRKSYMCHLFPFTQQMTPDSCRQ